jgi:NAD(P)-dependent dehydrogenase (short-subunit alcohol dehydrogenase family)
VAHAFVKNGVSQIALGDINEQTAQETANQLKSINKDVNAIAIQVDVANEDSVKASIETATAAFGRIDFAVNNAGINGPLALASDVSFEDWKKTIDINLSGVWLCQRAEITQMLLQEYSPFVLFFSFFHIFTLLFYLWV